MKRMTPVARLTLMAAQYYEREEMYRAMAQHGRADDMATARAVLVGRIIDAAEFVPLHLVNRKAGV